MQPVAEFVKQRQDIVVCQERRAIRARWQEVAHEIRDRQRGAGVELFAADAFIHPGAAAFVGSRVGIEIEAADGLARAAFDLEVAHVRVPYRRVLPLPDADPKQALRNFKQSGEHLRQREVGAQLFL